MQDLSVTASTLLARDALLVPICRDGLRRMHEIINSPGCGLRAGAAEHGTLVMALHFQTFEFRTLYSVAAAAVAGSLLMADGGLSRVAWSQGAPFSALAGSWSGAGTIRKSTGSSERIRCRATYSPSGNSLSLRIRCASDSYNADLSASVASQGGAISGSWQESTRGVGGDVSGQVSGGGASVHAVASGPVTSTITVRTSGSHQSVFIHTPGSEVPEVSVSLSR
jgi:hypothetical protein